LILASASPRRRQLLDMAGVSCRVRSSGVEERPLAGESAGLYTSRAAGMKARAVALRAHPGDWVLAADTTVDVDGDILGKPRNDDQAREMLSRLSGRDHRVLTGVNLLQAGGSAAEETLVETVVTFRTLSTNLIEGYLATGEPLDKAGAYGIQGRGAMLVRAIQGSYTNVVGLPLVETLEMLESSGLWQPFGEIAQESPVTAGEAGMSS